VPPPPPLPAPAVEPEVDELPRISPELAAALDITEAEAAAADLGLGATPLGLGDLAELDASDLEVEMIELAVAEPAGEDAGPEAIPPQQGPDATQLDRALADTGEVPLPVGWPTEGEPQAGSPYQRRLTRAIVRWEGEVSKLLGQRDKARDAFVKLRERAQELDGERAQAIEQLRRAGREIARLRGILTRQGAGAGAGLPPDGAAAAAPGSAATAATAATEEVAAPEDDALRTAEPTGPVPPPSSPLPSPPGALAAPTTLRSGPAESTAVTATEGAEARLARALRELAEARDELDRAWRESDELTVRLGEAEDRLHEARETARRAEQARAHAEAVRVDRDQATQALVATLEDNQQEIVRLGAELEAIRTQLDDQTETLAAREDELRTRTGELADATAALVAARQELEAARAGRTTAERRAEQAERGATAQRERAERMETLERRAAALQAELEAARGDTARWEGKASRLTASLDVARAEAEGWRDERERLLADLTAAREQLQSAVDAGTAGRRPGGPTPLVVVSADGPPLDPQASDTLEDVGELADALRAADAALARAERRSGKRPAGGRPETGDGSRPRDEVLESQRAQIGLLQMELDLARQQLREAAEATAARDATTIRRGDRRLSAAVALAENRLGELPAMRAVGQDKQKLLQTVLTRLGTQMSQVLKACADSPALRAGDVGPEQLFQDLKSLAAQSADLFSDRRFLLDRDETVLKLLRDRLRDLLGSGVERAADARDGRRPEDKADASAS
jgi:hypothetical protein